MISKKNILNLEARRKIYEFVAENPGLHVREISRRLDIPRTTLLHHLRFLERQDLVELKSKGEYKLIYTKNELGVQDKAILELLRTKIPCQILLHMYFTISCSQIELSKELDIHPSTVSYHLKKMMDMGIIEEAPVEDGNIYPFPNPEDPRIIKRTPKGREIFYRRKNQKFFMKVAKILISHKNSLSDTEYIDDYLFYLRYLLDIGAIGKKHKKDAEKKVIKKDGKKVKRVLFSHEEDFYKVLSEFFKPPFCA